jgi:xanthine dehydrogenase YagS FAD-binding subunit
MNPFSYQRAPTPEAAVAALAAAPRGRYLAGGTTLVDLLRLNVETPDAVVDLNALPLRRIEPLPDGGLRIGALVTNSDLAAHDTVRQRYPALAEALLSGASPQIRNMASVGGNLLQRTRCYYFRDTASPCNKRRPGSGCAALGGYNRIHAVLGGSEKCIATFPGDMPVALAALDATVRTRRPGGAERTIPLTDFHLAYGDDPARETVLEHGELIIAVDLPAVPWFARSVYVKVRDRASFEFALASAAVALDLDVGRDDRDGRNDRDGRDGRDGRIRASRIALGGVATKPWRARQAESVLAGARPGEAAWKAAAAAALAGARPQRHNAFKIELAQRTLERALALAAAKQVTA